MCLGVTCRCHTDHIPMHFRAAMWVRNLRVQLAAVEALNLGVQLAAVEAVLRA